MIIDDEDHHIKLDVIVAGSTIRYPDKVVERSSSSLPDYEASEAQHRLVRNTPPSKNTRNTRILKATIYALAIYVALSAVIVLPLILRKKNPRPRHHHHSTFPGSSSLWTNPNSILYPPAFSSVDAAIIPFSSSNSDCSAWRTLINSSPILHTPTFHATFPPTSPIAIRSNVTSNDYQVTNGVGGSLTARINPDHRATDVVVLLEASASDYTLLQQTNVCLCQQDPNRGLIIYTPGNLVDAQYLDFTVQVLFPKKSFTYVVPEFTTYLPQFSQYFTFLSKTVTFSKVSLFGTLNDIVCQSIQAPLIGIQNIRAAIIGNFNVSESLNLDTINGPITANITVAPIAPGPTVFMDTGNGAINADITLTSHTVHSSSPPIFVSRLKTFSAPINLLVKNDGLSRMPVRIYAANNQAPINITLDPSYQGLFAFQTKLAPVNVNNPPPPSQISFKVQTYEIMSGWIGSGPWPSTGTVTDGHVEAVSALGPISLNFASGVS
ncbi:hypothetical protein APHAL10511_003718 [Amanita phalloides]|nr:hypothetical protein APHAL10511_003718 [Amanita phalloides]